MPRCYSSARLPGSQAVAGAIARGPVGTGRARARGAGRSAGAWYGVPIVPPDRAVSYAAEFERRVPARLWPERRPRTTSADRATRAWHAVVAERASPSSLGAMAQAAGIVLAGGRSSRMGTPKAALEWHGSTLLRRVTGIVGRSVDGPVVVVRAPGQDAAGAARRRRGRRGRARGHAGRSRASPRGWPPSATARTAAYVSSTDVPLLHPRFVRRVLGGARRRRRRRAALRRRLPPAARRRLPDRRSSTPSSGSSPRTGCAPRSCSRPRRVRVLDDAAHARRPGARGARPRPRLRAQPQRARRLRGRARAPGARGHGPASSARCGARSTRGRTPPSSRAATLGAAAAAVGLTPRRARRRRAERRPDHARPARRRSPPATACRSCPRTPAAEPRSRVVPCGDMEAAASPAATSAAPSSSTSATRSAETLPLPDEVLRAYIGGAGLGAWLMHELAPAGRRPARRPRRRWRSASRRSSARR